MARTPEESPDSGPGENNRERFLELTFGVRSQLPHRGYGVTQVPHLWLSRKKKRGVQEIPTEAGETEKAPEGKGTCPHQKPQ